MRLGAFGMPAAGQKSPTWAMNVTGRQKFHLAHWKCDLMNALVGE
jgi:hypothetical protein